jgi:hypothetical protein
MTGDASPLSGTAVRGDGPALLRSIEARLPDLRLLTDPLDREAYRRDETAYLPAGLPLAVALPVETAQVAELVRLCGDHDVPIVPRGAGTGLSGGAAGIEGALTIAFTRMNRVLEIDAGNLTVTTSRQPSRSGACSTRRTRPPTSPAPSAATSGRTRAGCAA